MLIEVALLIGFLVLACRWVFGPNGVRRVRQRPDYGLLTPVLRTDDEQTAVAARELLATGGIKATVAPAGAGFTAAGRPWPAAACVVLVFPADRIAAEARLTGAASR